MRFSAKSALALLAVGAIALSGCNSSVSEKPSGGSDVLAALRTESATALQTALTKTKDAKTVSFTMSGVAEGEKINGSGAIEYGAAPKAEFTTVDAAGEKTLIRMIGTAVYTEIPVKERAEMDGKSWLKLDLAELVKLGGGDADNSELLRQTREMDPSEQLKALLGSGGLKVVGEEKIDGVPTVHYSRVQTPEEFMAQLAEKVGQQPQAKAIETLKKSGVTQIAVDVWVDEKYQPRRARTVMGKSDVTIDFRDYGKAVTVATPPAAQTADLAEMLKQLKDLAGGA
jgi:hypothetical protein